MTTLDPDTSAPTNAQLVALACGELVRDRLISQGEADWLATEAESPELARAAAGIKRDRHITLRQALKVARQEAADVPTEREATARRLAAEHGLTMPAALALFDAADRSPELAELAARIMTSRSVTAERALVLARDPAVADRMRRATPAGSEAKLIVGELTHGDLLAPGVRRAEVTRVRVRSVLPPRGEGGLVDYRDVTTASVVLADGSEADLGTVTGLRFEKRVGETPTLRLDLLGVELELDLPVTDREPAP